MSLTLSDFKSLLVEIRDTDSDRAFRRLYDESYDRMFRTAFYYTQSDELAREVVLDVLAGVWEKRKTMILPDDWWRWSYIATKNLALNTLEKENRRRASREPQENDVTHNTTPSDDFEAQETQRIYEETVWSMPDRCREAWILVREDGLSHHDAAVRMGTSEKTVDAQISKALRALRDALLCIVFLLLLR